MLNTSGRGGCCLKDADGVRTQPNKESLGMNGLLKEVSRQEMAL